jgi:soluble lytic murein transglycosylase
MRVLGSRVRAAFTRILTPTLAAAAALLASPALGSDEAVLIAAEAFQKRDAARLARQVEFTRDHVLGQYVEYWNLRLSLDGQPVEAVKDFLDRYQGTYLAERLRADWLRALARAAQWDTLQAERPGLVNEDAETACYGLFARFRQGDLTTLDELRPYWMQARELPEGCVPLADRAIQDGRYLSGEVWDRARVLSDAGQVGALKRTLGYLPQGEEADAKTVDLIHANPQRVLDKVLLDLNKRVGRELYALALGRLARRDVALAQGYFTAPIQAKFPPAERAHAFAQLALPAARNHLPEAVGWYAQSSEASLSDEHLAWRVRAALRARNWAEVKRAVDAMGPSQRSDPAWMYWHGRALRELGFGDEARVLFGLIAGQHHFYGNLAAEELGQRFATIGKPHATTPEELKAVAGDLGMQRALALYRLEMRSDAMREWNWTTRTWDDAALLAAAELARRHQIWDRAINTADRTVDLHNFWLRYLAPYRELFAEGAKATNLEESWVLGLTRQESRFISHARSHAGAAGLMQLMPATARLMAKEIGLKSFSPANVTAPEVNIQLGTGYLRKVLDELDGHPVLASAAYNAGPGRAQRWRADRPLEGAIYAETIPFNETRDYVKRVFSNTMYYAAVLGGERKTLKARLGVIPPRNGAITTAQTE